MAWMETLLEGVDGQTDDLASSSLTGVAVTNATLLHPFLVLNAWTQEVRLPTNECYYSYLVALK